MQGPRWRLHTSRGGIRFPAAGLAVALLVHGAAGVGAVFIRAGTGIFRETRSVVAPGTPAQGGGRLLPSAGIDRPPSEPPPVPESPGAGVLDAAWTGLRPDPDALLLGRQGMAGSAEGPLPDVRPLCDGRALARPWPFLQRTAEGAPPPPGPTPQAAPSGQPAPRPAVAMFPSGAPGAPAEAGAPRGASGVPDSDAGFVAAGDLAGCQVEPLYPRAARRAGMAGVCEVEMDVDAAGFVVAVRLTKSTGHDLLDEAALEAARRWRFAPATRDGTAVPSTVVKRFRFELRD